MSGTGRRFWVRLTNTRAVCGAGIAFGKQSIMSERDTFGPRLRRERERRGISLDANVTLINVSLELWEGFESGDLSRWPTGLYARAFVRDYAKAVGLDPDEVVDDFCRLFPLGDRRALPVIAATADLIGHDTTATDDPGMIPGGVDRRGKQATPAQPRPQPQSVRLARIFRAIFHT